MDEYSGFAQWGLLWVLAGVLVWGLIKVLARPSERANPDIPLVEPELGPPTAFDGLVFPGQPIIAHAAVTLENTFDALNKGEPDDVLAEFHIFLTALVIEAYVTSFQDDLGIESGNLDTFSESVARAAEQDYEKRFGPWTIKDDDDLCENFYEAVVEHSLMLDGLWVEYAQERDRKPVGAWHRMLRRCHMDDHGFDAEGEAADLIAARIAVLRSNGDDSDPLRANSATA